MLDSENHKYQNARMNNIYFSPRKIVFSKEDDRYEYYDQLKKKIFELNAFDDNDSDNINVTMRNITSLASVVLVCSDGLFDTIIATTFEIDTGCKVLPRVKDASGIHVGIVKTIKGDILFD